MLSNTDIDALEDILFAEPWGEDALDFFGLHGVVCAGVVGPAELSAEDIFRLATGTQAVPDGGVPEVFRRCVQQLAADMAHALDMSQALELPEPEDGDPMNALENWCAGFCRHLPGARRGMAGSGQRRGNRRFAGAHADAVRAVRR